LSESIPVIAFSHGVKFLGALSLIDSRRFQFHREILAGCQQEIRAERNRKLEETRKHRQIRRQQAA
jgi:hypothetical protein